MTYEQKLSHINALIQLAQSDSIYSEIEHFFVQRIADKIGVKLEDLNNYNQQEFRLNLPSDEDSVIPLFHRLVIMISIDEVIKLEERDFCFHLGVKMGLHPQAVSQTIDLIAKEGPSTDPNKIIDLFDRYTN